MRRTEVVNQISQAIRRVAPTATAILYGSEARGDAREDSDIDVLILLDGDKMTLKHEMDVTGPLNEIEWQTGVLVSPTVMLRKQWENMPFKTPFYINRQTSPRKTFSPVTTPLLMVSLPTSEETV